uniref:Cytochrome c biogenesis C n=1 Tax=Ephedra przewalskii TaxID=257425 RepID=A0A8F4RHN4_9SPER|nr:cytochrome c biogenesis C [Ephedra przewalskii]
MFFMNRSYAPISHHVFRCCTSMAMHASIRFAPTDFQQGEHARITHVHVPAARISLLVHIAAAIGSVFCSCTLRFLWLNGTSEIGAVSTLLTSGTGVFRGKPMWGTFRVWDARLTTVFLSSCIIPGALVLSKLTVEPAPLFTCVGLINLPIIKFPVTRWNTSHQPGSISPFSTSIHVPMLIPIWFHFASFLFHFTCLIGLETRMPAPDIIRDK